MKTRRVKVTMDCGHEAWITVPQFMMGTAQDYAAGMICAACQKKIDVENIGYVVRGE